MVIAADGVVGGGALSNSALLLIASRVADRGWKPNQVFSRRKDAGRTRERNRPVALGRRSNVQTHLLETRGGAPSLSLTQRNPDADHIRCSKRGRRYGRRARLARGERTTHSRENTTSVRRNLQLPIKKGEVFPPLPLVPRLRTPLWQRFDVDIKLKASCLLNAKQESHVDSTSVCDRGRQRYCSGRQ